MEGIWRPTHLTKYMNRHNADTSQEIRDIAQHLLSYEAAADSNSETNISAACRVLEALRRPLCTLVGVQGFRVLLARALTLGRAKVPSLTAVTINPDGSLAGFSDLNADEISTAGAVLTAQLLGLLATFMGEGLMRRILLGVWPDLTVLDTSGSGENE